jgi:hypothetical protein
MHMMLKQNQKLKYFHKNQKKLNNELYIIHHSN